MRACKNCGADFQTKDEKQRFCKAECYRLYGYKRMKVYKGRAPSVAQYDQMLENAAGKCAICQQPCERLVLDHCHSTAVARGLLCSNCNSGLGMFGDSIERLTAAIAYLRHFEERVA